MKRFTQIKGLSQARRLPRLGKIRLGIKKKNKEGKEYPAETPYFVVPEEVMRIYGEQPTELDVMLPVEQADICFPQNYAFYGSSRGLKCSGDGERAMRTIAFEKEMNGEQSEAIPIDRRGKPEKDDMGDLIEVPCTCELADSGKCKQAGYLQVMLPKVSVGGVYQITTSSYNSIVDLNSGIDYVRALIGRVAMVPLKLKRVPTETHHEGKKQTHYTLRLVFEGDVQTMNFLRENTHKILEGPRLNLPAPEMENPTLDQGATVIDEDETAADEPMATHSTGDRLAESFEAGPATVPTQTETAKTKTKTTGKKIDEGMRRLLTAKLKHKEITEAELCKAFGIDAVSDLDVGLMNQALMWIDNPGGKN